jgi:polar amino acid transport system permease protein
VTGGAADSENHGVARPQRRGPKRSRGLSVLIAFASTLVVGGGIGYVLVTSTGWSRFQQTFFDFGAFADDLPEIASAFVLNIKIFLIAEVLILAFALLLAIMRSLRDPVFFPVRAFAIVYADLFRGIPSVLIVFLLGFGLPSLELPGVTKDPFVWGLAALVIVWVAYVSEVYRAGIESVHPSQDAAARSLGLSGVQSFRYVVLPQAVRRVVPPLMNDFIGLQKDSALVAFLGPIEAFRQSQIDSSASFTFTPYVVSACLFLAITVPLTRLVDWLVARDRRRSLAGAR